MTIAATLPKPSPAHAQTAPRQWPAHLQLELEQRGNKTLVARSMHCGPLRVQRPFYPESDGCAHLYLLHPPGGMAIGDSLALQVQMHSGSALLTTPSASRIYGAQGLEAEREWVQEQRNEFTLNEGSCLEWLPQETIVFDAARVRLHTRIELAPSASVFAWDIVRLGRIASGETFQHGACEQRFEIWCKGRPLLLEKNVYRAASAFSTSTVGFQNKNTFATLVATVQLERDKIDALYQELATHDKEKPWALTQKKTFFIARYLGNSVEDCRAGFELIWRNTRVLFNHKNAVYPRIWNT